MNVRRSEVSGRGEVPGVGANLDGEGGAVGKVENHGLRSVHPAARLDLPVLYGRYRFADGLENRLQFVLWAGWADYLGVFSATRVLAVHPCSFGFLRTTSTLRHRASYPRLAVSPVLGRQAPEASPGSSSNWIYRTAAQGTNALRAWSSSVPSSLIASTVIPPALLSTNLASKPRPLPNRTAIRCPFHSLDKYPAMSAPPLSACDLRASYPSDRLTRSCW